MKTARDYISEITTNKPNLEHIADYGKINGSLLIDIEKAMKLYACQILNEAADTIKIYSPDASNIVLEIKDKL